MSAKNDARSFRNVYGSVGMKAAFFFACQRASCMLMCMAVGCCIGFLMQLSNGFGHELLY